MNARSQELLTLRSRRGSETSCQEFTIVAGNVCIPQSFREGKNWCREGVFATTVGQSKVRHPAGTCCAHPPQDTLASAAVEPEQQLPELTARVGRWSAASVSFTPSHIFLGLQILKSGCNQAICSWTENVSGDWCGEGWKEGGGREESSSPSGQGKGAATFWESS